MIGRKHDGKLADPERSGFLILILETSVSDLRQKVPTTGEE
jgi:hypothetical protein